MGSDLSKMCCGPTGVDGRSKQSHYNNGSSREGLGVEEDQHIISGEEDIDTFQQPEGYSATRSLQTSSSYSNGTPAIDISTLESRTNNLFLDSPSSSPAQVQPHSFSQSYSQLSSHATSFHSLPDEQASTGSEVVSPKPTLLTGLGSPASTPYPFPEAQKPRLSLNTCQRLEAANAVSSFYRNRRRTPAPAITKSDTNANTGSGSANIESGDEYNSSTKINNNNYSNNNNNYRSQNQKQNGDNVREMAANGPQVTSVSSGPESLKSILKPASSAVDTQHGGGVVSSGNCDHDGNSDDGVMDGNNSGEHGRNKTLSWSHELEDSINFDTNSPSADVNKRATIL